MSTIKIPHNGLPQEIADDIMRSIQTHKDLMYMEKFDKERTDKNIKGYKWKGVWNGHRTTSSLPLTLVMEKGTRGCL